MTKVLGLDLGVASIGWALVDWNEAEEHRSEIMDTGVRIFQGNNERAEAGSASSANQTRRMQRSIRRNRDRTKRRKRKLLHIMRREGMAPSKKDHFRQWVSSDPYELRARGLDEKLSLKELGRAFYHINQRRGFKSNRKASLDEGESVVWENINELEEKIQESRARTLGEYLYLQSLGNQSSDAAEHTRIRGRYTHRSQYEDEFEQLWESQKVHHPQVLTKKLRDEIHDAIFYQRPLSSQAQFIGHCELEKDKKRIARGHRLYQEFRVLKNLNNLSATDETGEELLISDQQKKLIREKLGTTQKSSFKALKKLIGWNSNAEFNFERVDDKMPGHSTNAKLSHSKAFGERWFDFDEAMQDHIIDVLIHVEKEEVIVKLATEKWGCSPEQADYMKRLELEPGYGRFSHKAISKLLPLLREGKTESEAIKALGYDLFEHKKGSLKRLPHPDEVRNPVVYHAMVELRKVVNAVIRKYGMPDRIRVELARELKSGSKRREEIQKKQRKLKKLNDEADEALRKAPFNIQNPTYNDRLWYKLWKECDGICPYSGESIPASAHAMKAFEIEHILPFSRSVDNSYMNKTLCKVSENAFKGNKTPFEAYGQDSEKWDAILQRIRKLPKPKAARFQKESIELDDFIQRQLNDTQYISVLTADYLKKLKTSVEVVNGATTSIFRRNWELNRILDEEGKNVKNRDDHRHHAVDGLVVALTTPAMMQRLAKSHDPDRRHNRFTVGHPWPSFYEQAENRIGEIIVSHRVHRSIRGALHEDTYYGPTAKSSPKKGQEWLVVRKPVHQLTKKEMGWKSKSQTFNDDGNIKIRDPRIRELVQAKFKEKVDEGLSFKKAVEALENDPPVIPSPKGDRPIKKVRLLALKKKRNFFEFDDDNDGQPERKAIYGKKHHIAIYSAANGKDDKKQDGVVVPMMEAARRKNEGEPVILRDDPDMDGFVMSLAQDEMIRNLEDGRIYRLQKMDNSGQMTFRIHTSASTASTGDDILRKMPGTLNAEKIRVSPIGEIRPAHD